VQNELKDILLAGKGNLKNVGRRRIWRKVSCIPAAAYFKPAGVPLSSLEEVNLLIEEAEAVRLKDLEAMEQESCAQRMRISRTTFARILDSARAKVADAILNGKAIRIEGGDFEMAMRRFRCRSGHEWEVPFETLIVAPPAHCPSCDSARITPVYPENPRHHMKKPSDDSR
jgi:predicted DNA-binding protein (UPF0251 family)